MDPSTASASPPPNELDRFVQAVACAPNDSRAEIRDTIGELSDRAQVASLLRHNVILD